MEGFVQRSSNKLVLLGLVGAQLLLLGYQIRSPESGSIRTVRLWSAELLLPLERQLDRAVTAMQDLSHGYLALRGAEQRNQQLQARLAQLELQNQRLQEQTREVPGLRTLLQFQQALGLRTLPAQVISSGASADAQAIYLGRGSGDGLARNMPVITPDGLVGKVTQVLGGSAQVLLVTDPESGAGAIIGAQGVHGVVHGLGAGRVEVREVLKDEPVKVGDAVVTSGEDQVFPKGIPIGTVTAIGGSADGVFRSFDIKLAANLGELENVLVITGTLPPAPADTQPGVSAFTLRQQMLPSLPTPASGLTWPGANGAAGGTAPPAAGAGKPQAAAAKSAGPGGHN